MFPNSLLGTASQQSTSVSLHPLTLFNNRPNCYTLHNVDSYRMFSNQSNCYTLYSVDSYPMFPNRPNCYTLHSVHSYPIISNRLKCYTLHTVHSYPMFSTQSSLKASNVQWQTKFKGTMFVNSLKRMSPFWHLGNISLSRCKLVPQTSLHAGQIRNTFLFLCPVKHILAIDHSFDKI